MMEVAEVLEVISRIVDIQMEAVKPRLPRWPLSTIDDVVYRFTRSATSPDFSEKFLAILTYTAASTFHGFYTTFPVRREGAL